jgi:FkbM family methyltransferase
MVEKLGNRDDVTIKEAMNYVTHRETAVDVGAYIGDWTRPLCFLFDQVYAFEPDPILVHCLYRNLEMHTNVAVFPAALGEETRRAGFTHLSGGRSHIGGANGIALIIPLDALYLESAGLLKFDCEGYELFAVRGAIDTIRTFKPVVILEENDCARRYGLNPAQARKLLESEGMEVVFRYEYLPENWDVVMAWPKT